MTDQETQDEGPKRNWFQRLMVHQFSSEQRALYGTLIFFATIMAVGWVMLNEPARLDAYTDQFDGRSIQRGALIYANNCSSCHGPFGQGAPGVAPNINSVEFFDGTRQAEVAWAGTWYDYVELTIAAGRPVMAAGWANPMPTWGQQFGGPLRNDQVIDITNYVMNWSEYWVCTAEDPDDCPEPPEQPEVEDITCDAIGEDPNVPLPAGNPERGAVLYSANGRSVIDGAPIGCQACHSVDGSVLVGPSFEGIFDRITEYGGFDDANDYLHESIVAPNAFLAPGFENGGMPVNFGERLCAQDVADLIAYIYELNGEEPPEADPDWVDPSEGDAASEEDASEEDTSEEEMEDPTDEAG